MGTPPWYAMQKVSLWQIFEMKVKNEASVSRSHFEHETKRRMETRKRFSTQRQNERKEKFKLGLMHSFFQVWTTKLKRDLNISTWFTKYSICKKKRRKCLQPKDLFAQLVQLCLLFSFFAPLLKCRSLLQNVFCEYPLRTRLQFAVGKLSQNAKLFSNATNEMRLFCKQNQARTMY